MSSEASTGDSASDRRVTGDPLRDRCSDIHGINDFRYIDDFHDIDDIEDDDGWDDELTAEEWAELERQYPSRPVTALARLAAGRTDPTFAREHLEARQRYTVLDGVVLAVRRIRCARGLSQRLFARRLGWSKSKLARLEADPAAARFGDVIHALDGSGFELAVIRETDEERRVMVASDWRIDELIGTDRAGRRFAAAAEVTRVGRNDWGGSYWWCRYGDDQPAWTFRKTANRPTDPVPEA